MSKYPQTSAQAALAGITNTTRDFMIPTVTPSKISAQHPSQFPAYIQQSVSSPWQEEFNTIIPKKAAVKSAPKKNTGRSMLHSPAPNYGGLPMGLNRYKPLTGLQLLQQSKSQKRRKQRRATRKNRSRK